MRDVKEFEIGLDWVTFSQPSEEKSRAVFRDFSRSMVEEWKSVEERTEKRQMAGYVGVKVGNLSYLQRPRDGHALLVAFGADADKLTQKVLSNEIQTKPTRIDVAATVRTEKPVTDCAVWCREKIRSKPTSQGSHKRTVLATFEGQTADTGVTVGSRSGAVYGRIYDYALKHTGTTNLTEWRAEIEYKQGAQERLWAVLRDSSDLQTTYRGVMAERLERWGIPFAWLGDCDKIGVVGTKEISTLEKQLRYTKAVIIPMFCKISEAGKTLELVKLLQSAGLVDSTGKFLCEPHKEI